MKAKVLILSQTGDFSPIIMEYPCRVPSAVRGAVRSCEEPTKYRVTVEGMSLSGMRTALDSLLVPT